MLLFENTCYLRETMNGYLKVTVQARHNSEPAGPTLSCMSDPRSSLSSALQPAHAWPQACKAAKDVGHLEQQRMKRSMRPHLHAVAQGVRNGVQDIGGAHEQDLGKVDGDI